MFFTLFCFVSLPVERSASLFGTDYALYRFDFLEMCVFLDVLGNTIRSGRDTPTAIVSDGIALKKDYCGFVYCNDGSFEIVPLTFDSRGMFLSERVVFLKGGKRKMFYG